MAGGQLAHQVPDQFLHFRMVQHAWSYQVGTEVTRAGNIDALQTSV